MTGLVLGALLAVAIEVQAAPDEDAEAVKATLVAMWDAIEKGDVERYASYVHPDFTAFGENDVYLAEGKALEVASYADYLMRARSVHTEMHQPKVVVRGDVAWITYYWTGLRLCRGRTVHESRQVDAYFRQGER